MEEAYEGLGHPSTWDAEALKLQNDFHRKPRVVVCGAGGFVGGQMVKYLVKKGFEVRAVSSRPIDQWLYVDRDAAHSYSADLRDPSACCDAVSGANWVYNFAAKVGGIGYIGDHKLDCLLSSLINTNLLRAVDTIKVAGYFFASSACIYGSSDLPISETDTLVPSSGYGEEKIFSERMCRAFHEERNTPVRIARFTGIYGPGDSIKGRENKDHAPSALARKVVSAKLSGIHEIAIWGDGKQVRNFLYVDDAVEAAFRIMHSNCATPINVGTTENINLNGVVDHLEEISGTNLARFYDLKAAEGVRSRIYSLKKLTEVTKWIPQTSLRDGLRATYNDIWNQAICNSDLVKS
jgi:nucleoside-diphosphate-sugar epimerase